MVGRRHLGNKPADHRADGLSLASSVTVWSPGIISELDPPAPSSQFKDAV